MGRDSESAGQSDPFRAPPEVGKRRAVPAEVELDVRAAGVGESLGDGQEVVDPLVLFDAAGEEDAKRSRAAGASCPGNVPGLYSGRNSITRGQYPSVKSATWRLTSRDTLRTANAERAKIGR